MRGRRAGERHRVHPEVVCDLADRLDRELEKQRLVEQVGATSVDRLVTDAEIEVVRSNLRSLGYLDDL